MADSWAWALCDLSWHPLPGTQRATARKLSFAKNRPAVAQLQLGLADTGAIALFEALRSYIPRLVVWRNRVVVFEGHWWPMSGGRQVDQPGTVNLVFKDSFALLDYRLSQISQSYVAEDAGFIAQQLIDESTVAYGPTSIDTTGLLETTTLRTVTYENKIVSEAIIELAEMQGGFDWYPTYRDPDTGATPMLFNVVAKQGTDRPGARFELGDGTLANLRGHTFNFTLPVTVARAVGLAGLTSEQASGDEFGSYATVVSASDVDDLARLADIASDALRQSPAIVTAIVCDPARSPQPWDDFWIGDTICVNLDDGALQQQLAPRVQTVDVSLDDEDNVSELVIGIDEGAVGTYLAPANTERRYVQQQREVLRRLSALER